MKENFFTSLLTVLFGDPFKNSLEHRLFSTISLLNGILNIIGSVGSLYLQNFEVILLLNLTSGILMIGMYFLSRFKNIYHILYWPFNLIILTYLSITWFYNGGSMGGNHYYFIPALVIATILLRDHNVYLVYFFYICISIGLFTVEFLHKDFIIPYVSDQVRYLDVGGNFVFVQILTGILIFILSKSLNAERKKSDSLLLNILPESVASELKYNNAVVPVRYESISILFTDMAGFTSVAEKMSPEELVRELDLYFRKFDEIIKKHQMEKIKTIGDAYMAAGGLPLTNRTHAIDSVLCGLEFQRFMSEHKKKRLDENLPIWELRLGIHTGSAVAGVIGKEKFAYDIWGDSVNTASRLESSGIVGEVNISQSTYDLVREFFICEPRGKIKAKNKGEIEMYLVKSIQKHLQEKMDSLIPNAKFLNLYQKVKAGESSEKNYHSDSKESI